MAWRESLKHGSFCGYVGGVGREFLLWVVGDGITYDGMYVMRHRDISELEAPDKHHAFFEKALALKHILPRMPRGFPLDSIREVVEAASAQAPVIGVHGHEDESEVCYIGRLVSVEDDGFYMQELSPDAEWMREVSFFYELRTRFPPSAWKTAALQSLLAVAGPAPALLPGDASGLGRAPSP
ncbi:hypothetical protein RLIN73S_06079 [Rhodanobacter lindaniclasticus]